MSFPKYKNKYPRFTQRVLQYNMALGIYEFLLIMKDISKYTTKKKKIINNVNILQYLYFKSRYCEKEMYRTE